MMMIVMTDCVYVCMYYAITICYVTYLAGAVLGDSLGIATQGMTRAQVKQAYGNGPVRFGLGMEEEDCMDEGVPFVRDAYRMLFDDKQVSPHDPFFLRVVY